MPVGAVAVRENAVAARNIKSAMMAVECRIDEDRIARSGELRYFNHQRFGVQVPVNDITS